GRTKQTRKSLGQHKSEGRNPRSAYSGVAATRLYAERSPKSERQTGSRAVLHFGLRILDFFRASASGFGLCPRKVTEKLSTAMTTPCGRAQSPPPVNLGLGTSSV